MLTNKTIAVQLEDYELKKSRQEASEHRDVLLAIAAVINTNEGKTLFKYLFKSFDVAQLPGEGMDGKLLYEYLGFLRAGNSIFKLASESASETAAGILAKIERERYEDKHELTRIQYGLNGYGTADGSDDD